MLETISKILRRASRDLPWWTWPTAFLLPQVAAWGSIPFVHPKGAHIMAVPVAIGLVLVQWWGLRVLFPIYLSLLLGAPFLGIAWSNALFGALTATGAVFLSWLLFSRLVNGKTPLPDVDDTIKFLLFGLLCPLALAEFVLEAERLTSDQITASEIWRTFAGSWLRSVLAGLAVSVPALMLLSGPMVRRGWAVCEAGPGIEHLLRRMNGRWGEISILFAASLALAATVEADTPWFLFVFGGLVVGFGLRFGGELAALYNAWVVLVTYLPVIASDASAADLVELPATLASICIAGLVTGRSISDGLFEIERRKETQVALRDSEVRLRSVIENMPVMVEAFDDNWNIAAWNRECERVTGFSAAEVVNNPEALRLLYPDDTDRERMLLERVSRGEAYRDWESVLTCKDGTKRIVAWSNVSASFPIPGWRAWGIGIDVSEWRESEAQLRDYANQAQTSNALLEARQLELEATNRALRSASGDAAAANRAKSEFLANMSHEIRTPMTAILGFTDILLDSEDSDDSPVTRLEALETIKRNGEYLLDLINDILDLSKIEAGRLEIQNVWFSPVEIVEGVRSLMSVRAKAKNLTLGIRYATPVPELIRGDPTRVRQVLINLIGNAVKFTEVGGIRVIVGLREEGEGRALSFDVVDTGIGIREDQLSRIFEPFSQEDGSTTRRFGGTGLGLSICKRLCELMGGTILVESEVGSGSTFRVLIPAGEDENVPMTAPADVSGTWQTYPAAERAQADIRLDGARILVAEDGPDNQRLIQHVLTRAGAVVTLAENGQVAVELATEALEGSTPFDLILMDIQMPIVDGYLATQILRRLGYTYPIIALTAHAMAGDRERCVEAGCDDFASKPIERPALLEIVRRYVGPAKNDAPAS